MSRKSFTDVQTRKSAALCLSIAKASCKSSSNVLYMTSRTGLEWPRVVDCSMSTPWQPQLEYLGEYSSKAWCTWDLEHLLWRSSASAISIQNHSGWQVGIALFHQNLCKAFDWARVYATCQPDQTWMTVVQLIWRTADDLYDESAANFLWY